MLNDHFTWFLPLACAGLGLCLIGAVNLLLPPARLRVRLLATIAIFAATLAAAAVIDQPGVTSDTARYLALGLLPCLLLSSRRVVGRASAVVASVQRPAIRFGLVTAAGIAMVVASVVVFERADREVVDSYQAELDSLDGRTET